MHESASIPHIPPGDLWVFAYGSLIWNPGFNYVESVPARVHGYHRSLCVWSHVHRGTPENPGLVLGLDAGGSCKGRAYRIEARYREPILDYLYARELPTTVYHARLLPVRKLNDSVSIQALGFVVDRGHHQYAGKLTPAKAANQVRDAAGLSGPNLEYLQNTLEHLNAMQIEDHQLSLIQQILEQDNREGI